MSESTIFNTEQLDRWNQGIFLEGYNYLGSEPLEGGTTRFRVWAPNARKVNVAGTFNDWNPDSNPMEKDEATGIWFAEINGAAPGDLYKYQILTADNTTVLKADPYACYSELRPDTASVIYRLEGYHWNDNGWKKKRKELHRPDRPLSLYEVHLGSWKRKQGRSPGYYSYGELANQLIPYVKDMGFTHIELMPVAEHPYDPSWGYQITGFYAPTSRYGPPRAFMQFVDKCHEAGIGVILDWVPGHFPDDDHGLSRFDGTPLYEHPDPKRSRHKDWDTNNFDHEKTGVRNFLLSNANYWAEMYHIDGFRVDGVASMLYLDYSKERGEWLPNVYGGNENLGALTFLQDFNTEIHEQYPSLLTIAEESTSWPGITRSIDQSGLGFDFKWNMGWMNDTLHFFGQKPAKRIINSHHITFPLTYAFDEKFVLPLSHDEVVHLKKSLWNKMPGSGRDKAKQLKLLLLYWATFPGKLLLFMGGEFGQLSEWSESTSLEWNLLEKEPHRQIKSLTKDLLHFYKENPALFETDCSSAGFEWLALDPDKEGRYAFLRRDNNGTSKLAVVFNVSDREIPWVPAVLPGKDSYYPVLDTESGYLSQSQDIPKKLSPYYGLVLSPKY